MRGEMRKRDEIRGEMKTGGGEMKSEMRKRDESRGEMKKTGAR